MISTIVKLLLAFPRLGALFFKVHKEYEKKLSTDRYIEHRNRINDWVREPSSTRIPEFLHELQRHDFSASERETIAEILHYVNSLENE